MYVPAAYTEYAANIRKEYIHVPLPDYCHRRTQVSTFQIAHMLSCVHAVM